MPPNTVGVARPARWGNPWKVATRLPAMLGMGEVPDHAEAVRRYGDELKEWTVNGVSFAAHARTQLAGKNLACWCRLCAAHRCGKPLGVECQDCDACHADVLLRLANEKGKRP